MIALVGFVTFILIITLLLVFKVSPVPVFIVVPALGALMIGVSPVEIGSFIGDGILQVMDVGTLFIFAMLYFGIMSDAGLFDPLTGKLKDMAGSNIVLVTIVTVFIAMVSHLDGTGASTLLVTIPALLPVYKKLQMNPLILLLIVVMSAGVMNLIPWGGPLARVAVVLDIDPSALWVPLIPVQIIGIAAVLLTAIYLGKKEKKRIKNYSIEHPSEASEANLELASSVEQEAEVSGDADLKRPGLWWFNLILTIATIVTLIFTEIEISAVFMIVFALALVINYPNGKLQMERMRAHASEAFTLVTILIAAGAFLGIVSESGMVEDMTTGLISVIPEAIGPFIHLIIGVISVPLLMVLPPDAYLFAFVSLLVEIGAEHGVPATSVAYASAVGATISGYISPLVPATYLAIGLAKTDLATHIKFSIFPMWLLSILLLAACILLGLVTI
ncbi:CitMHS family transporter [Alteribacillus bidgolensis]|uniref:Citrate-Mg2+:H+ or citrate-Ca2+:H+ symporter, CitMHS family n=1 Tax=Alteribacillus bidgolensis TaxID=930129 RepID=A0A1G8I9X0_9BACI|nr:citrate:proton symporter [Alteribacillus bidgolensis]SDI15769.1 citrate-Mg2+:H+ or citrate-Ca2+:H+ symporter, CitMHS family [Alteribacillus bidgolensis]